MQVKLFHAALLLIGACLLFAVAYRWLFTAAYFLFRSRLISPAPASIRSRFAVLIPAHNESLVVASSIRSIMAADYDRALLEVYVVADNCDDDTAAVASGAGARALVRTDPGRRGKGQALAWALGQLPRGRYDAVVVIDADTLMDPAYLRAMDRELQAGHRVLQGYDGIANPDEGPLTRLIAVTCVMKNLFYNAGKSAIGVSPLLMGTGMTLSRAVVEKFGWSAGSIGEDLEQTFTLLHEGERIRFVPDAIVYAQEAVDFGQGFQQRQRWASGRAALAATGRKALAAGLRQGNLQLVDAGLNILLPTYSKLLNYTVLYLVAAAVFHPWSGVPLLLALSALLLQAAEFLLGLCYANFGWRYWSSTLIIPVFMLWKALIDVLAFVGFKKGAWTRTRRHDRL
jgi:cellulose synthase/poly-beta-1,6-N-acetylglucosamine synthase-like glycosyltransferase